MSLKPIDTLLVANRGEIACRVMGTAKAMGIKTVAVHSAIDANARHVREADLAVNLGGAKPADSYLRIDALIAAAKASGAQAIVPNNSYFQYGGGTLRLTLTGPATANFDLYLQRWNGYQWVTVASSTSPGNDERISYNGSAAYYRWYIYSYAGAGIADLQGAIISGRHEFIAHLANFSGGNGIGFDRQRPAAPRRALRECTRAQAHRRPRHRHHQGCLDLPDPPVCRVPPHWDW